MARAVDWPARIAFCIGTAALLTLYLKFPDPRTHDALRAYSGIRAGAWAAVVCGGAMLTVAWAQRRWREYGSNREKRRAIRLATLLQHADPLTADVAEQGKRIEEIAAGQQATERKVDTLLATFADVLEGQGDAGASLQKTQPLPLYLAARDGEIVSDEKRDAS